MIDIENYVVNAIQSKYATKSITITVTSAFEPMPSTIPCVMVRETGNSVYRRSQDPNESERHVEVIYQVDIVTGTKPVKSECKKLLAVADEAMREMKFTRADSDVSTNSDRTLAWGTARYTGIVGAPTTSGTRKTYQMYR